MQRDQQWQLSPFLRGSRAAKKVSCRAWSPTPQFPTQSSRNRGRQAHAISASRHRGCSAHAAEHRPRMLGQRPCARGADSDRALRVEVMIRWLFSGLTAGWRLIHRCPSQASAARDLHYLGALARLKRGRYHGSETRNDCRRKQGSVTSCCLRALHEGYSFTSGAGD